MRKLVGFLAGVICGALVGAVAAILLAPYGGVELRQRVRDWVQDLVEKGREAAMSKRAELETQLEAFKRGQSLVLQDADERAVE